MIISSWYHIISYLNAIMNMVSKLMVPSQQDWYVDIAFAAFHDDQESLASLNLTFLDCLKIMTMNWFQGSLSVAIKDKSQDNTASKSLPLQFTNIYCHIVVTNALRNLSLWEARQWGKTSVEALLSYLSRSSPSVITKVMIVERWESKKIDRLRPPLTILIIRIS